MEIKELRIGNLIDYFGDIIKVDVIDCFDGKERVGGKTKDGKHVCDKPTYFEPIKITDDILDKITQCTDTYKGDDYSRYIVFSSDDPYDEQEFMEILISEWHSELNATVIISRTIYPCVKYIHQLQNVYHSLTDNELEFEL